MENTAVIAEQLLQSGFGVISMENKVSRLPQVTRDLAARTLAGEFGRQMRAADFCLPPDQSAGLSPVRRYAETVRLIAEKAPLRVLPFERLAGASTLLEATLHRTPATGDADWHRPSAVGQPAPIPSTSHTTLDFEKALRVGYAGIRQEIEQRLAARPGAETGDLDDVGVEHLECMRICVDAAGLWHDRYIAELARPLHRRAGPPRRAGRRHGTTALPRDTRRDGARPGTAAKDVL